MLTFTGLNGRHAVLRIALLWVWLTPVLAWARADAAAFDLPAQSLEQALEQFSVLSGWSVMYPGALADDRRSHAVMGVMPPAQALQQLLQGTGLAVEGAGEGRVVLRQAEDGALGIPMANTVGASATQQAFGDMQRRLRDAFCSHPLLAPGDYTARVGFRVGAEGRVQQPQLLLGSGAAQRDLALVRAMGELQLSAAAAMLPQPVTLEIRKVPASHDCSRRPSP